MIVGSQSRTLPLAGSWPRAGHLWRGSILAPLLSMLVVATLVLAPFVAGALGTPHGMVFTGTLKALGDEGVYMAAVNAGAHGDWLWHDPFMVNTPAPILMYPAYIVTGHVGALLGLSVRASYVLLHVVAALALVGALWILALPWLPERRRAWFVAFALGMSGLYWLDALLAASGHAPSSLAWLGLPPLGALTSALMGAHETLFIAGQCVVFAGLLGALRRAGGAGWWHTLYGLLGTVVVGFTMPMLLPVTLLVSAALTLWWCLRGPGRQHAWIQPILRLGLICLPGVALALYYYWQFRYGSWAASPDSRIQGGAFSDNLLSWAVLLPLACWGWYRAPAATRPLAHLLGLWCLCAAAGSQLPLWQSFRLVTGLNAITGALFALGLFGVSASGRRLGRLLLLASLGALCHLLFVFSILAGGQAPNLYVTATEDRAMRWLGAHATADDVALAPLGFSNRVATFTRCRLVTGHGQLTFDFALRERQLHTFYGAATRPADRLAVLRATGATYVVYDIYDFEDGHFDPRSLPVLRPVFTTAGVTVFRVDRR